MEQHENKMGTARMGPLIFSMALPAMISMIINAMYNIVDSIFVARYATDALTAVSLVFPLQTLVIAIAVGTGVGVNSLIARRLGEKRQRHADSAATHGMVLAVIGGLVFVLIGLFLVKPFLLLTGGNVRDVVIDQGMAYGQIAVGLSIFVMVSCMCEKIQQSTGNMIIPMFQVSVGAIINIILDPLLIFGIGPFPEMGIRGAAIATVIGQFVGMLIGLWGVFCHQKLLDINLKQFRWRGRTVADIYRVGLPGIVMQSVVAVMTAGLNAILGTFSEIAVSVLGVYFKLQTFVFMPVFGLNQGALPVMGYNYGARKKVRLFGAYKITLSAAVIIMLIGLVLFQTLAEPMILLFADPSDQQAMAELLRIGVPALKTISLSFIGAAFGIINSTVFQAVGRGMASLIVSVCRQLVIILPVAWLFGSVWGVNAIWYAFPVAEIAAFVISYVLLGHAYRTELRFLDAGAQQSKTEEVAV